MAGGSPAMLTPVIRTFEARDIVVSVWRHAGCPLFRMIAIALGALRAGVDGEFVLAVSTLDLFLVLGSLV